MITVGALGAIILLLGLALFLYYEPADEHVGNANARISGVYRYDPQTGSRAGASTARFSRKDVPAAVVDWSSSPPDMVVAAHWYDINGQPIGGVPPAAAADQANTPIPIDVDAGAEVPTGGYVFVVERFSGGRSVQVLARSAIKVDAA